MYFDELLLRLAMVIMPALLGYSMFEYLDYGNRINGIFLTIAHMLPG
ncbi:MAG: hypothetical protein MI673_01175 [Thiotrichales bacterium]|nr:hypothetical protein [Thiotrichales bacterium]